MRTYTAQRGEAVQFLLYTPLDTDITGWSVACQMRREEVLRRGIEGLEAAATLAVTSFAGDETRGPGWYFTLASAISEGLRPDLYQLDARVTLPNAEIAQTDPWALRIINRVTEPS